MGYLVVLVLGILLGGKWYELRDVLMARRVANMLKAQKRFRETDEAMDLIMEQESTSPDVGRVVRRVLLPKAFAVRRSLRGGEQRHD